MKSLFVVSILCAAIGLSHVNICAPIRGFVTINKKKCTFLLFLASSYKRTNRRHVV